MIKRIVLALDGSPEAEHALPVAQELALALGAAVTIVHVREMMIARSSAVCRAGSTRGRWRPPSAPGSRR